MSTSNAGAPVTGRKINTVHVLLRREHSLLSHMNLYRWARTETESRVCHWPYVCTLVNNKLYAPHSKKLSLRLFGTYIRSLNQFTFKMATWITGKRLWQLVVWMKINIWLGWETKTRMMISELQKESDIRGCLDMTPIWWNATKWVSIKQW